MILNHFSQRYKPIGYVSENKKSGGDGGDCDETAEEDSNVQKLLDEAKLDFKGEIIASYDLFTHKF